MPTRLRLRSQHRARRSDRGYVTVLFAIASLALLGIAAFALDAGLWYKSGARSQRAADAAALAAIEQYVELVDGGTSIADATTAATATGRSVLALNGIAAADATFSFTKVGVTWHSDVQVTQRVQPLLAGMLGRGQTTIRRDAQAVAGACGATCGPTVLLERPIGHSVNAGTGGDGYISIPVNNLFFNQFHHISPARIHCIDPTTQLKCTNAYPVLPYSDMSSNQTPILTAIGNRIFFIVQAAGTTGLGCWDASTHAKCAGFANPFEIAPYKRNPGSVTWGTRFGGPIAVGNRLFLLGDDTTIRCIDVSSTPVVCSGYPKSSAFTGNVAFDVQSGGIANGIVAPGVVPFDMALGDGGRIYLLMNRVKKAGTTGGWISCWDTTTNATCSGFGHQKVPWDYHYLFVLRNNAGADAGICARVGWHGSNPGHSCYPRNGGSWFTIPGMFSFVNSGWGHTSTSMFQELETASRTVFPFPGFGARCWDWTRTSGSRPWGDACSGFNGTGWAGKDHKDYGYTTDGGACVYGLGDSGKLWSFNLDDGHYPCDTASASATLYPCTCVDRTEVWTRFLITDASLSDFSELVVTITLPDGTVWFEEDLVILGADTIDLSGLPPGTDWIRLDVVAKSVTGDPADLFVGQQPGVVLDSTRTPSLIG